MNFGVYKSLWHTPVGALLWGYALARLPIGINAVGLAMSAQLATGSVAQAGLASSAYLVAMGVQAPLVGRWIDRRGTRGVVQLMALAHVLAQALLIAVLLTSPTALSVAAAAALVGATMPPVGPIFRAVLRKAQLTEAERHAAFALDAVLVEISFVGGPLVAAAFAAAGVPWVALALSGVLAVLGSYWFVASGGLRLWGEPEGGRTSWLGPWRHPRVRGVLLWPFVFGVAIGMMEMGLTAAAAAMGTAHAVGWAFAAMSVTSALAGVAHGSRAWALPHGRQFALGVSWLGLGALLLSLSGGIGALVAWSFLVGFAFAPAITAMHSALSEVAPSAEATEAFTWMGTLLLLGLGAGWALAGAASAHSGWQLAMWGCGALMIVVGALALWTAWRTRQLKLL